MKTKDMPSVRAAKLGYSASRHFVAEPGLRFDILVAKLVRYAYMAGYRHGRKMEKEKP